MDMDRIYAEAIANEYAPKNTSKVMALKKLDRKAKSVANIFAYTSMRMKWKLARKNAGNLFNHLREDYAFKTEACAGVSLGITGLFALYNGYLGLTAGSIWHGSICAFHLVLAVIRALTREPFANPANNFLQYSPLC